MKMRSGLVLVKVVLWVIPSLVSVHAFSEGTEDSGVLAFNEGRYEEAEEYFLSKLDDADSRNESLVYLSRVYLERGDTKEAIERIEQALEVEPTNSEEVLLSGDIYCNHGQRSSMFTALRMARKCIAQYESAVSMDPENTEALVTAISFYFGAPSIAGGSEKKGNEFLERLYEQSPEHAKTYKVKLLEEEGETDAALKLAGELSKNEFQSAKNQYEVARYYKEKEVYDESKLLFESLLDRQETPANKWHLVDSLLQLGEIYLLEGEDRNKGIDLIEKYRSRNKNPNDVHYFWSLWSLAKGYEAIGDNDKYEALVEEIKSKDYENNAEFAKEFEASL